MKIRALVAKTDGAVDSMGERLMPGCVVNPTAVVHVLVDFDPRAVIGRATLSLDGNDLYADIELPDNPDEVARLVGRDDFFAVGFTPAIGGQCDKNGAELSSLTVQSVSLNRERNADPRIPVLQRPS